MRTRRASQLYTDRAGKIIEFLYTYPNAKGYPPCIREIGDFAGIPSTSVVNYYLDKLEKEKLVERDFKVSRGTFLTEKGKQKAMDILNIPSPTCPHCGLPWTPAVPGLNPLQTAEAQEV